MSELKERDTAQSEMLRIMDISHQQSRRIAELEAERDKLKKALEQITDIPVPEGYIIQQPCKACQKRNKIAREALKGGE